MPRPASSDLRHLARFFRKAKLKHPLVISLHTQDYDDMLEEASKPGAGMGRGGVQVIDDNNMKLGDIEIRRAATPVMKSLKDDNED